MTVDDFGLLISEWKTRIPAAGHFGVRFSSLEGVGGDIVATVVSFTPEPGQIQ
jgi:hypothetical protein